MREYIFGLFYLFKAFIDPSNEKPIIGSCAPNGEGDIENAKSAGLNGMFRIEWEDAVEFSKASKARFYVTIGSLEEPPDSIASKITSLDAQMSHNQPLYWSVANEPNKDDNEEFVTKHFNQVLSLLPERLRNRTVKGAYYSAVESMTWKVYVKALKNETEFVKYFDSRKDMPHLFHAYLAPTWKLGSMPENFKRFVRMAYITGTLKKFGYRDVILDETHDGSYTRKGMPIHGDLIYQSGAGFRLIVNMATRFGIGTVMHYQASMLGYDGNTTKDWKHEKFKITQF